MSIAIRLLKKRGKTVLSICSTCSTSLRYRSSAGLASAKWHQTTTGQQKAATKQRINEDHISTQMQNNKRYHASRHSFDRQRERFNQNKSFSKKHIHRQQILSHSITQNPKQKKQIRPSFKRSNKALKLKLSQEPTLIFTLFQQIKKLRELLISQHKIKKKLKNELLQYSLLSQLMLDQHTRLRKTPIQVIQQLASHNFRNLIKTYPKDHLIKQLNKLILKLDETYFQFKKDSIDDLFQTINRQKQLIRSVQMNVQAKKLSKILTTLLKEQHQNKQSMGRSRLSIAVMETGQPELGQFQFINNSYIKLQLQLSSYYR